MVLTRDFADLNYIAIAIANKDSVATDVEGIWPGQAFFHQHCGYLVFKKVHSGHAWRVSPFCPIDDSAGINILTGSALQVSFS